VDHTRYVPQGGLPARNFTEFSGSVGLLIRPAAARDNLVIVTSLAHAARPPALEELYFFGPHLGNFAFEVGNPDLESERALGVDVAVRARGDRFEGEVSFFRNGIDRFIFRNPISEEEFQRREEEFDQRFGVSHEGGDAHDTDFPYVEYVGRDSTLWGVEAHGDLRIRPEWVVEFTFDMVRGTVADTGEDLPRIPPYRGLLGLRYQKNGLQAGASVTAVADQNRVFGEETPTSGYATVRAYGSYAFTQGRVLHTLTARLENATNERFRNHLNYLKDQLLEMGRTFRLVYAVGF